MVAAAIASGSMEMPRKRAGRPPAGAGGRAAASPIAALDEDLLLLARAEAATRQEIDRLRKLIRPASDSSRFVTTEEVAQLSAMAAETGLTLRSALRQLRQVRVNVLRRRLWDDAPVP